MKGLVQSGDQEPDGHSLSSMIIYADGRILQKDKHHCNTPPIWTLRRCGQTQSMKTHLELAQMQPKGPTDSEEQDSLV